MMLFLMFMILIQSNVHVKLTFHAKRNNGILMFKEQMVHHSTSQSKILKVLSPRTTGNVTTLEFFEPANLWFTSSGNALGPTLGLDLQQHISKIRIRPTIGIVKSEALQMYAQNLREVLKQ